ncbi:MAG: hypothetical protein KDB14_29555 [Planctomycetales bacterium]|nr:hypothetical protein [Planctomycetales bacterium]
MRKLMLGVTILAVAFGLRMGLYRENVTVNRIRTLLAEHSPAASLDIDFQSAPAWRPSRVEFVELRAARAKVPDAVFDELLKLTGQRSLVLNQLALSERSFLRLGVLKSLERLELDDVQVILSHDEQELAVPDFPNLETLVWRTRFFDVLKLRLNQLPKLSRIHFYGVDCEDAALEHLTQITELHIAGGVVSDATLTSLRQLPRLQTLILEDIAGISPAAWAELSRSESLRHLYLRGLTIDDEGLQHLVDEHTRRSFRALVIDQNLVVTGKGLLHLERSHLQKLSVYTLKEVSDETKQRLQSRIPGARIKSSSW